MSESTYGLQESSRGLKAPCAPPTPSEQRFLDVLIAHMDTESPLRPSLERVSAEQARAGLSEPQADFIHGYLQEHGDIVELMRQTCLSPGQCVRALSSPAVYRILNAACAMMPNIIPPVPSKGELEVAWSVESKMDDLPSSYRLQARQEISKLRGYYASGDTVNVGVQVVLKETGLDA